MTPAFLRLLDDMPTAAGSTAPPIETREDTDHTEAWHDHPYTNGHEPDDPITDPIAVAALHERLPADDDFWLDDLPSTAVAADPSGGPIGTWKPDLIERPRFRVVQPWYRPKTATAALTAAALAAVAIVVSAVLLVSRGGEHATSVTPEASTAASPPPSRAHPAPSSVPPAAASTPPAPPPPPPPSASPINPPPVLSNDDSWSPSAPSPTKKPEIGVTRAPMSVAPPPPPPPTQSGSATPGVHKHGFGPW